MKSYSVTSTPMSRASSTKLGSKFKGDIIDYPDFIRKLKVERANFDIDFELDRLKDNVPIQASKALYGTTTIDAAWGVLNKLYGDKYLNANELEGQLKNIKPTDMKDKELVIDLITEVHNVVLRLKFLGYGD